MTDEQAVVLFQSGSSTGLGFLYDKYFPALYRYFLYQIRDSAIAEDLTSATMLGMAKGLHRFKGTASFKNYLYQIAKNQLAHYLRKNRYELPLLSLLDSQAAPESDYFSPETQQANITRLNRALSHLSPRDQHLLRLRYLDGYSVAETARELNLSVSNVKVKTLRLLKKLRAM